MMGGIVLLDEKQYSSAISELAARDQHLAGVVELHGPPPFWTREPGFAALVYLILEQQVSLASAKAAYDKLIVKVKKLTPGRFLKLTTRDLRVAGFSRQKILYARLLAKELSNRRLNLPSLHAMDDQAVRVRLTALKGIGPWTADIYIMFCLGRADAFAAGDLALQIAAGHAAGLDTRPSPAELIEIAERWRPWRGVAAHMLWAYYKVPPDPQDRKKA